jgi:hypothetical protein
LRFEMMCTLSCYMQFTHQLAHFPSSKWFNENERTGT